MTLFADNPQFTLYGDVVVSRIWADAPSQGQVLDRSYRISVQNYDSDYESTTYALLFRVFELLLMIEASR
jgi:hypothetical protein